MTATEPPEIDANYRVIGEEPRRQPFWGPGSEPIVHWRNLWTMIWIVAVVLVLRWIVIWAVAPINERFVDPTIDRLFH